MREGQTSPSSWARTSTWGPVGDAELRADVADVPLGGAQRDRQSTGDGGVGRALGHQPQDVELTAGRERFEQLTCGVLPDCASDPRLGPPRSPGVDDRGDDPIDERGRRLAHEGQEVGDAPAVVDEPLDVTAGRREPDRRLERSPGGRAPAGRLGHGRVEDADRDQLGDAVRGFGLASRRGEQAPRLRGPGLRQPDASDHDVALAG